MKRRVHFSIVIVFGTAWLIMGALDGATASVVPAPSPSPDVLSTNETFHIQIECQTECISPAYIKRDIEAVLRSYEDAALLSVAVVDAPAVNGSAVTLRVMMNDTGEIVLERNFTFTETECKSARQILLVVLEQFLSGFPIEEWKAENKKPEIPLPPLPVVPCKEVAVPHDTLVASWRTSLGVVARFPTPGGALEIGTGPDVGTSKNGFVGKIVGRVGYPHVLENGRVLEMFALMGLGWRGNFRRRFQVNVHLRAGSLYVRGFGFDSNRSRWLPWVDAQVILAWRIGFSSLGLDIGGSPLQYSVSVLNGEQHNIAFLHVGLHWSIPFSWLSKNE